MSSENLKLFAVVLLSIFCSKLVTAVKLELASKDDCDRYSLDALYYEKYSRETENAFADIIEFVNSTTDRMYDSLSTILTSLPGRDYSEGEERQLFLTFSEMKKKFIRSANKLKSNITSAWESLIQAHFSLMLDDGKFSLTDVLNRTNNVTDIYVFSRSFLDAKLEFVISSLKNIVRSSLKGIYSIAETELKKQEEEKSKKSNDTSKVGENHEHSENVTSNINKDNDESQKLSEEEEEKLKKSNEASEVTENHRHPEKVTSANNKEHDESQKLSKEELLRAKRKELVKSLTPGFLGTVTNIILDKDLDLEKNVTKRSDDRDSVLDDIYFTLVLVCSRVNAIIHDDTLRDKPHRDLARRNLYMYFAEKASHMYEDRLKKNGNKPSSKIDENSQSWNDEDYLAEVLVRLMEDYP